MRRQRADGTWTLTTVDWDRKWYWPVGTRVTVPTRRGAVRGTVVKTNPVSVWVQFDEPDTKAKVEMRLLSRVEEKV
jgi:hypothetical protein